MAKGRHYYKLARKSRRQSDAKLYVRIRQQQNKIAPKALSKEIKLKTHILQSSPTFSLVHDPKNAVVTGRIGESFRTLKKTKGNKYPINGLDQPNNLNHSSQKIAYRYRQQQATCYFGHSLHEQSSIISKQNSHKNPVALLCVACKKISHCA